MVSRRTTARPVLVAALAAVLLLTAAPLAFAATGEPTLGLAALQDKLDAAPEGRVSGYMKTVLRGSLIETIPVEVLGMTGDSATTSLILFQASGPKIDAVGGIASGMSGSPIYVEDAGVWKVIGAVSYGDFFALDGAGLATPIESMLQLRVDYSPRVQDLSKPVLVSGRLIDRVIVSVKPENQAASAASGAFVAKALPTIFIGGLRPGSGAYIKLATSLAKKGVPLVDLGSRLSAGTSSFSTELVPGAAVAALASRGDMWIGGIGTLTYADGDTVLAYGHPAFWSGSTSLYMANAWIAGVWPSLYEPYKIGYPATIQGTFTQDRLAGIMGEVGASPAEAPLTAEVVNTDTGRTGRSSVWISSKILATGMLEGVAGAAVSAAGYQVFDSDAIPGSAVTTTTIVVSSGGHEYTIVMLNIFDDSMDIVSAMTEDVDWSVYRLLSVLGDGLETPHIVSAHLQASATSGHRNARIVGVNALAPLHAGDNAVRVSILAYGIAPTQTVDTTVTIPEDSALTGELVASCFNSLDDGSYGDTPVGRESVADIVDELNTTPAYNTLLVEFVPSSDADPFAGGDTVSFEASATTPWYLTGSATAAVTEISAYADAITYGEDAYVTGEISGPTEPVEVRIYGPAANGIDEELLATGMAEYYEGTSEFDIAVPGLSATTELRVAFEGSPGYAPAETFVTARVRGRVRIGATPRTVWRGSWVFLTATVAPGAASGPVKFQYYDAHNKKWRTLITKRLTHSSTSARATCSWRPAGRGTFKVRAVYGGNGDLANGTSPSISVKVR
jgi:hypothetical protein